MALQKRLTEKQWLHFKTIGKEMMCSKYYTESQIVSFYQLDQELDLPIGDTIKTMALFLIMDMERLLPKIIENNSKAKETKDLRYSPQVVFKFLTTEPNNYTKEGDYEMMTFVLYSLYGVKELEYFIKKRSQFINFRRTKLSPYYE